MSSILRSTYHLNAALSGWYSLNLKPPPFSLNLMMVIMAKQLNSYFIRSGNFSTKLFPVYAVRNCNLAILLWSWSSGFFLAEKLLRLIWHKINLSAIVPMWTYCEPLVFILAHYCLTDEHIVRYLKKCTRHVEIHIFF